MFSTSHNALFKYLLAGAWVIGILSHVSTVRAGLIIDPAISTWSDEDHIDFAMGLPVSQFALFAYNADGSLGSRSSGYALTDGKSIGIKTARHGYFDSAGNMFNRFEFRLGRNFNSPSHVFQLDVADLYLHAGATDQALAFPDFGVASSQIQAARNWEGNYALLDDTDFVFAGFGRSGNTSVGFTGTDGFARAGINAVYRVDEPNEFRSRLYPPGHPFYRETAILAGPGDSGGFAGIVESGTALSFGTLKGGSGSSFLGTSLFHFSDRGFDAIVFASRAVPEPSSGLLLLFASFILAAHRRRMGLTATQPHSTL